MQILVLGGTGEARALAARLVAAGIEVTSSLAGRVSNPALPVGDVRIGGFGGAGGLGAFLREHRPAAVVDATHPFAATITTNAATACAETGTPLLVLRRPGWTGRAGDRWTRLPTIEAAAEACRTSPAGTIFLTTGRRDLGAFAGDGGHDYVVRTVDPPDVAMPPRTTLLLARGPYDVAGERALMTGHGVGLLVTKDSGGALTEAKLDAARELGIPVLVVDRPPLPNGVRVVDSVGAAVSWATGTAGA